MNENYSVLLADDEEFVFDILMKKMNWEEMGFHIDGYARNGHEALELAEQIQPDVVMTDIRMPYMDGLSLCRELKKRFPGIKVIIFSGFDDFEYAKAAIKSDVFEYILKPIDAAELKEVFVRMKTILDQEVDERRNIDILRKAYEQSLPILQDNFYISLIEGSLPVHLIEKYASDYQITLKGPEYVVSIVHVSYLEKKGQEMETAPFMLNISVRKLIEDHLKGRYDSKTLIYLGDIVVVSQLKPEDSVNDFTDYMDPLCNMAQHYCKAIISIGIGNPTSQLGDIQMSYKNAKTALSYRAIYGNMHALHISDVEAYTEKQIHIREKMGSEIIKALYTGNEDTIKEAIHDFCLKLNNPFISLVEYKYSLIDLISETIDVIRKYELDVRKIFDDDNELTEMLSGFDSNEKLEKFICDKMFAISEQLGAIRNDSRNYTVKKAEDYIIEHFAEPDMSIERICAYLNVSASYFSTVFKKHTEKTFSTYLTDYRMEQAVKLLQITEMKSYEVAEKVGYSDANYFSYAFKKKYGVSPSKYRKNLTSE